ncbi:MAG: M1 family aminopeptidase [Chloroflexota bacterium]
MKRSTFIPTLLLLTAILVPMLGACALLPSAADTSHRGILYYDIAIEMDPAQGIFRSQQQISLTASLAQGRKLTLFIGGDLVVDTLALEDGAGNDLPIAQWQEVGSTTTDNFWGKSVTSEIEIRTTEDIPRQGLLKLNLAYHLPPQAIQDGPAGNIYDLFVSARGSHAGGPESGAFPMVSGSLEAPFTMTITHPNTFLCALPGEAVSTAESGGFVKDVYRSEVPYDPSFSCAPYNLMAEDIHGLRLEIFTPQQVDLSPHVLATAAEILSLYREQFGEPSARSFRIVFPDLLDTASGGESNGNLIFLANVQPFLKYDQDETARDMFVHLVAHEGYHLWNAWSLTWEGSLAEWWVEGGATFMASWATETLYGPETEAGNRLSYLEAFEEQEAYRYERSLANLDENWFDHWALVYNYGALVWEQLRQKVGTEALLAGLRDFYQSRRNQKTGYADFIASLQKFTQVDVAAYLEQWTRHNARIDLAVREVAIQPVDGGFEVQVELEVNADRDYELFTALGYKTSTGEDWRLIDLHLVKSGQHRIEFESAERPLEIQIDPEYRVPQIDLDDNTWVENK